MYPWLVMSPRRSTSKSVKLTQDFSSSWLAAFLSPWKGLARLCFELILCTSDSIYLLFYFIRPLTIEERAFVSASPILSVYIRRSTRFILARMGWMSIVEHIWDAFEYAYIDEWMCERVCKRDVVNRGGFKSDVTCMVVYKRIDMRDLSWRIWVGWMLLTIYEMHLNMHIYRQMDVWMRL